MRIPAGISNPFDQIHPKTALLRPRFPHYRYHEDLYSRRPHEQTAF